MSDAWRTAQHRLERIAKLNAKMLNNQTKAAQWLADGNEASERGMQDRAERCYEQAQWAHDRTAALAELIEDLGTA